MPLPPSLEKRSQARAKSLNAQAERIRRIRASRVVPTIPVVESPTSQERSPAASPPSSETPQVKQSRQPVLAGSGGIQYAGRSESEVPLSMQPWTRGLVNDLLEAASEGKVVLSLVWPGRLESVVPLHAMATLERNMAKDLRGLRTLLFPGTHTSSAPLQSILTSRGPLTDLYRQLWVTETGTTSVRASTESTSLVSMLAALNDIRNWSPEVPHPSLAETIPTFVFADGKWGTTIGKPLERSLRKVRKLAHRRQIRDQVDAEWSSLEEAPGALLVVHGTARKDDWRKALATCCAGKGAQPQVLLLDATASAAGSNPNAVKRIPDFLKCAYEHGLQSTGVSVITDDPKTFFILRAKLAELRIAFSTRTYAAEASEVLLSRDALPADWKPALKSNSNFAVGIVDRDASAVAVTFQRLAQKAGGEDSVGHKALFDACLYILRLSNLPAGYCDLTEAAAEGEMDAFSLQRNAWSTVEQSVRTALAVGALSSIRKEVETALVRARRLIDDCADATPMAARLLSAAKKQAADPKAVVVIVLPSQRYIRLAHRFLKRKLDADWAAIEGQVEWHTLATVGKNLANDVRARGFIFVGANPDVLRVLLVHPHIPNGTSVLVAYRQAESLLTTLRGMKELDAFKPYRGRIGLLTLELERRLKEVPNPVHIERLGEMLMTFKFDNATESDPASEQNYFRFEMEGGRRAYSAGWVYRYEPDEDPFFRRTPASQIKPGAILFDMTDDLRGQVESALHINAGGLGSVVHPERAFLKLYHQDVVRRSQVLFKTTSRSALATAIHTRMAELDAIAAECSVHRVYYWLSLSEGDTKPHAPKDSKFFKLFCGALDIDEQDALNYWNFIKNARRLNQNLGRALAAQYAEILFQPESAVAYRKIPIEVVKQLQQEALSCVFRVISVDAPRPGLAT